MRTSLSLPAWLFAVTTGATGRGRRGLSYAGGAHFDRAPEEVCRAFVGAGFLLGGRPGEWTEARRVPLTSNWTADLPQLTSLRARAGPPRLERLGARGVGELMRDPEGQSDLG